MRKLDYDDCLVGGLFFKERFCECLVGTPVQPSSEDPTPRTRNDDDAPREHLEPVVVSPRQARKAISSAVSNLVGESKRQGKPLISVSVGCVGNFHSLYNSPNYRLGQKPDENQEYGRLAKSPNYPDWDDINLYFEIMTSFHSHGLSPKVRLYTDSDTSAIGEYWYIKHKNKSYFNDYCDGRNFVFLKFSRSINIGVVNDGRLVQGRLQPLTGAFIPRRYAAIIDGKCEPDRFPGECPFHGDCLEGLIGEAALNARARQADYPNASTALRKDPLFRDLVSYYIAQLCIAVTTLLAPSRIVIGGRVTAFRDTVPGPAFDDILERTRGYFRRHTFPEGDIAERYIDSSPYYPAAQSPEFISGPMPGYRKKSRIKNNEPRERDGMPGIHGALRLAASHIKTDLERFNDEHSGLETNCT